jgi:hypothetical protein
LLVDEDFELDASAGPQTKRSKMTDADRSDKDSEADKTGSPTHTVADEQAQRAELEEEQAELLEFGLPVWLVQRALQERVQAIDLNLVLVDGGYESSLQTLGFSAKEARMIRARIINLHRQ